MNDAKALLESENTSQTVFQNRSSTVVSNESKGTEEKPRIPQILVADFPSGTSADSLLVYFQKFGEIVDITIPEIPVGASIAVITFKFAESVEKVLTANEPFIFRDCLLKITPLGNNYAQTSNKREPSYFTIKASNLPKEIPFQEVYNIFKQYGRIAEPPNICLKETEHEALIPYESINDAERLIEETKGTLLIRYDTYTLRLEKAFGEIIDRSDGKPSHAPFVQPDAPVSENESRKEAKPIEKTNIVEGKSPSEDVPKIKFPPQESESSAFIQVRNVNKLSSSDLLSLYFKSKRSGNEGGAVKHIDFKGGTDLAIVEFETTVSAEQVLSFKKDGRHTLEDQIIYVSKLPPLCKNRIFLRNVPQWITRDELTLYLESKEHNEVKDVKFNDGNDGAIITFANDIEIDSMRLSFRQHPYKDGSNQTKPEELELVPVVYPDAVLVYIGGDCSKDSIEMSLEDNLSKFASDFDYSVRYSIYNTEKEMWLVCFENYKAVALFPDNFELTINGKKGLVTPYFDYLGWRSKDGFSKGEEKADFPREHSLAAVNKEEIVREPRHLENSVSSTDPVNELEFEGFVNRKIKFVVHRGDITAENVDAIVNAANDELKHIGGLAKAIVDKGGESIQIECDKYIKKNGPLNVAGVCLSSPGGLPCKKVIHAVGPTYKDGRANEDRELRNVINNIIQIAIDNRFHSIAIPAISTGVFGYPVEKAIPIIVNAAILSSAESDCLNEIRFVDTNETTVKKFIEELKRSDKFQKTTDSINLHSVTAVPADKNRNLEPVIEKQPYSDRIEPQTSIQSPIKLVKDNIVSVAKYCDVIVNTTGSGTNDMLGSGAACKAIAAAAGQAYMDDVKKHYPKGIGDLPLAVTEAGSLGCKRVFHISCPPWDRESSLNILTDKIVACLDETESQKLTSIAFPAIGTGILRYPADLVASTMYNSVTAWFKGHPQCSLKTVIFVVFPADSAAVNAFEKEFAARNIETREPLKSSPINDTVQMTTHNGSTMSATNTATLNGTTVELIQKIDPKSNVECIISSLQEASFTNGSLKKTVFPIESPKVDHVKWQTSLEESLAKAAKIFTSVAIVVFENGVNTQIIGEKLLNIIKMYATETVSNLSLIQIMVPESDFNFMCNCLSELFAQVKPKNGLQKIFGSLWPFGKDSKGEGAVSFFNRRQDEDEPNLKLHIRGSEYDVNQAQSTLGSSCEEEDEEGDSKKIIIKPIIKYLDDSLIDKFKKAAAEHFDVYFHIDREKNKIVIEGSKAVEYRNILVEILDGLAEEYESQDQNHIINMEWFKRRNKQETWQLISEEQTKLENEYKRMNGKGTIVYSFEDNPNVMVDFDKMIVTEDNGQSILFYLKRRDIADSIPLEWDYSGKLSKDNEYVLVPLDPSSKEYKAIKTEVFKTAPATITIINIERVENPVRFHQYQALKRKMQLSLPSNIIAERKLFHGTNGVNVSCVCAVGFDRGLAGLHAAPYGHGTYFARDFSNSMGYTNSNTIFYAFVLTGRYTSGNAEMKTAPILERTATKVTKYDSVVDNVMNPSIFVVFTDNHAYPAYLITYV